MIRTTLAHAKELAIAPSLGIVVLLSQLAPVSVRKRLVEFNTGESKPIIFIPGYTQNSSNFISLSNRFRKAGMGPVVAWDYNNTFGSIESQAETLAEVVEATRIKFNSDKVSLVCHSLGGIVARYYLQEMSGCKNVDKYVTLETPHQGLWQGRYVPGICTTQIDPLHPFMQRLKSNITLLNDTQILSIYSDINPLSQWNEPFKLNHAESDLFIPGSGHFSMLLSKEVAKAVITFLK